MDWGFLSALISIFIVNIVLSGDNAVVIALASHHLPERQQKQAILWGSFGAVLLRIILTLAAVSLLQAIPLLHAVGGVLLIWIAYQLLDNNSSDSDVRAAPGLGKAIQKIMIADLVMSLDNVLAIAAIARDSYVLVIIGLIISIPLVIWGSSILMRLMRRFPIIVWAGAGVLAWTAGDMIVKDDIVGRALLTQMEAARWLVPLMITVGVLSVRFFQRKRR